MAEKDSPTHDTDDIQDQEIIDKTGSEESDDEIDEEDKEDKEDKEDEEDEDEEKDDEDTSDYKPKTQKRIKNLITKLRAKDAELEMMKDLLKGIEKKADDEDEEEDEDYNYADDKPLTMKDARKILRREREMDRKNEILDNVLIENGYKTRAERRKYGKGINELADTIQKVNPSLSYKKAVQKAYELKYEKVKKDKSKADVGGGRQVSGDRKDKTMNSNLLQLAKMAGISEKTLQKLNK